MRARVLLQPYNKYRYSCNIFKLACIFSRFTKHQNWMTVIADISVTVTSDISSWKFKNGFCWRSGLVSILNTTCTTRRKSTPKLYISQSGSEIQCVEAYNFWPYYACSCYQPIKKITFFTVSRATRDVIYKTRGHGNEDVVSRSAESSDRGLTRTLGTRLVSYIHAAHA